jgi:hypothetical protein
MSLAYFNHCLVLFMLSALQALQCLWLVFPYFTRILQRYAGMFISELTAVAVMVLTITLCQIHRGRKVTFSFYNQCVLTGSNLTF